MRYLILIFLFYSCSNNTESQSIGSRNKNFIDSLLKISNGARVEFDHSSKMVSIVARKITSRKGLDSLSAFIGTPTTNLVYLTVTGESAYLETLQ